jgi:hypothetical protein
MDAKRRRIWDFFARRPVVYFLMRRLHRRRGQSRQPVVHLIRPRCAQLFLMYAGLDAFQPGDLVNGLSLIDFLRASRLGDRNQTWIKDPYLDDYRQGIGGDAPNLAALEAWHRDHLQSLQHIREVYTLGYSSGAYGALYFGHLLGVKKVFAFSPRTATLWKDKATRARLLERMSTSNGVTQYEIAFATANKRDRLFAEMLAGCPGVTLHPYDECGGTHFLLHYLAEKGLLKSVFPAFAGTQPISSGAETPRPGG